MPINTQRFGPLLPRVAENVPKVVKTSKLNLPICWKLTGSSRAGGPRLNHCNSTWTHGQAHLGLGATSASSGSSKTRAKVVNLTPHISNKLIESGRSDEEATQQQQTWSYVVVVAGVVVVPQLSAERN